MFPELFDSYRQSPVFKRAVERSLAEVSFTDVKAFAGGSFRHIDDSPFGGGLGMIMRPEPLYKALQSVKTGSSHIVLLSPKGKPFTQKRARELSQMEDLVFICGHYEGVDARFEELCHEMISAGDYILTGGEIPCMMVLDSVIRLLDGALRKGATADESHENGLLEYKQYTKPSSWRGSDVPPVLLSGNHAEIRKWKILSSLLETRRLRPDMFEKHILTEEEEKILKEYENQISESI